MQNARLRACVRAFKRSIASRRHDDDDESGLHKNLSCTDFRSQRLLTTYKASSICHTEPSRAEQHDDELSCRRRRKRAPTRAWRRRRARGACGVPGACARHFRPKCSRRGQNQRVLANHYVADEAPGFAGNAPWRATVRWCDGAMVRWCDGAMVLWCDGAMAQWALNA